MPGTRLQSSLANGAAGIAIAVLLLPGCAKAPDRTAAGPNESNAVSPVANEAGAPPGGAAVAGDGQGDEPTEPAVAGIGASLAIKDGKVWVTKIFPETPAAQSNAIGPGDQIIAVGEGDAEPVAVAGMKLGQIVGMIRGPVGTTVRLTVLPTGKDPAEFLVVGLVREAVKVLNTFGDGALLPVGAAAPDFPLTRLADGAPTQLSQFSGRVVIVEFASIGCRPCIKALDELATLRAEHPDWSGQVEIVGVTVDEAKEAALKFVAEKQTRWSGILMVWAGPDVLKAFHVSTFPTLFVIDLDGKVVAAGHPSDIAELVQPLLRRPES